MALALKVLFIINSRSKIYHDVLGEIDRARVVFPNISIEVNPTHGPGDSFRLAHVSTRKNYNAVIGVGGDGTMNEIINGLCFNRSGKEFTIGLIPAGSANDLVKSTGSKSVKEILQNLIDQKTVPIDLGAMRHDGFTRGFLNAGTAGVGGLVFRFVEASKGSLHPRLNYTLAILRGVLSFRRPTVKIEFDNETHEMGVTLIVIGKGNYIGYGLGFTPQSSLYDGKFGITILRHSSYYQLASKFLKLSNNKPIDHPWISYHSSKRVKITVLKGRLPLETDGEYFDILEPGESAQFSVEQGVFHWV
ncbi:MAG: diacylglycerol kinase family lipid kinase [Salibacteraceae bacterium]